MVVRGKSYWLEDHPEFEAPVHGKATEAASPNRANAVRAFIQAASRRRLTRSTPKAEPHGNAATSAKPVRRSTADRVLGEFLGRVEVVRDDSYYLVLVQEVVVFGSYLSSGS